VTAVRRRTPALEAADADLAAVLEQATPADPDDRRDETDDAFSHFVVDPDVPLADALDQAAAVPEDDGDRR